MKQRNEQQILTAKRIHKTNHVLHLLLSVFTGGLWIPVWILTAITNQQREANEVRAIKGTHGILFYITVGILGVGTLGVTIEAIAKLF